MPPIPKRPPRPIVAADAQNRESARTLDALSGSGTLASLPPVIVALFQHAGVLLAILFVALLAYSNSFHAGMTLDNKYIIELDPRTKVEANLLRPSTWENENGAGWSDIWTKDYWWPKGISGLYRPIVTFTYWINWHVLGGDKDHTVGFHIINVFAHIVTSYLVFVLCKQFMKRFVPAAIAAVLYSVHPVTVESVTNIIGRADIFAAIAVIGGLLLYMRAAASPGWLKLPWLVLLFLLTMFGLFSKESAITLMGVVVLYDLMYRFPKRNPFPAPIVAAGCAFIAVATCTIALVCIFAGLVSDDWTSHRTAITAICSVLIAAELAGLVYMIVWLGQHKIGWKWTDPWLKYALPYLAIIIPIVFMFWVRHRVFELSTPPEEPFLDNPIRGVSWLAGRLTAFQVTVRLWGVLLWPYHLTADYSFNQVPVFGLFSTRANDIFAIIATIVVLAVVALAIWMWVKNVNKTVAFFILFFFATYLLTSNIVYTIGAIMAERFMYLPLVAFVALLAMALDWSARRVGTVLGNRDPKYGNMFRIGIAASIALLIAALYSVRTYHRNVDWTNDTTLWAAAEPESPGSFRTYQSYAFALFEDFQKAEIDRKEGKRNITQAELSQQLDRVIDIVSRGRPVVDQLPDNYNSSRLYLHQGMYNLIKAERISDAAKPGSIAAGEVVINNPEARVYLERAAAALERGVPVDRAFSVQNRQKEIQRGRKPEDVPEAGLLQVYEYLGNAQLRLDRPEKAMDAFRYMRTLDPMNPDAYVKIAMVYMGMNTDRYVKANPQGAANNAEQACIALLQTLWLDPSRMQLWQALDQLTRQISPDGQPIIVQVNGVPKLDLNRPLAQSLLCSMYQSFVRILLEGRATGPAASFRQSAIDSGFPQSLFDDIYKQFGRTPPPLNAPSQPRIIAPSGGLNRGTQSTGGKSQSTTPAPVPR